MLVIFTVGVVTLAVVLPRWRTERSCTIEALLAAMVHPLGTAGLLEPITGVTEPDMSFLLIAYVLVRTLVVDGRRPAQDSGTAACSRASGYLLPFAAVAVAVVTGYHDDSRLLGFSSSVSAFVASTLLFRSWRLGALGVILCLGLAATWLM
jgi:hypothetical protein